MVTIGDRPDLVAAGPPLGALSEFSVICESSDDGRSHFVTITGELDLMTVGAVRSTVSQLAGDIAIDLGGVSFIDSTGIGLLMMLHARQRHHQRTLALRNVNSNQLAAFDLLAIADMFDLGRSEKL